MSTLYKKVGRRYVPCAEYDNEVMDSFPRGAHLVMCYPGGESRRFNINPNHAALIAASRVAEEAMVTAMSRASELRPQRTPITEQQREAWAKLAESFGEELCTLYGSSAYDVVQAGLRALQAEAESLMSHAAVKQAYEDFLLVCELTKQQEKQ